MFFLLASPLPLNTLYLVLPWTRTVDLGLLLIQLGRGDFGDSGGPGSELACDFEEPASVY